MVGACVGLVVGPLVGFGVVPPPPLEDPPPPGYLGRWTLSYGTTVTLALAVAPRWLTVT